jgi:hypothetical protein
MDAWHIRMRHRAQYLSIWMEPDLEVCVGGGVVGGRYVDAGLISSIVQENCKNALVCTRKHKPQVWFADMRYFGLPWCESNCRLQSFLSSQKKMQSFLSLQLILSISHFLLPCLICASWWLVSYLLSMAKLPHIYVMPLHVEITHNLKHNLLVYDKGIDNRARQFSTPKAR